MSSEKHHFGNKKIVDRSQTTKKKNGPQRLRSQKNDYRNNIQENEPTHQKEQNEEETQITIFPYLEMSEHISLKNFNKNYSPRKYPNGRPASVLSYYVISDIFHPRLTDHMYIEYFFLTVMGHLRGSPKKSTYLPAGTPQVLLLVSRYFLTG